MRLGLLILTVVAGSWPAQAALPNTGCAAWHQAAALSLEGTIKHGGLQGRFRLLLNPHDGRSIATQDYGDFSESVGFDGRVGWSKDRSGASHDLNAEAARAITTTEAWILRRGWCSARGVTIESLPDETNGGVQQTVWRVTPQGGVPAILRFDRQTGLLHQSEYRIWGNRLIHHYDDWRDIGRGVTVAFTQRDEDPEDEDTQTIRLTSAKIGATKHSAVVFARPPQPKDYAVRGAASTTVPYEDDGGARIYVPAFVNGKGPFAFEIDTGGHLIIGTEHATTLGLKSAGRFANSGAGTAIVHAGIATGVEIRIGDAVLHNQVAKIRRFDNDRPSGKSARAGLLGLELFERFAVQVNRADKTVTLTPLKKFAGGTGTPLPIRFIEDAPLTRGTFNGVSGDFEIDSGNSGPTIIEGYWAHEHGLDTALAKGLVWGAGIGNGQFREWLSRGDIALGPIELPHQLVSYVGMPERGSESTRLQAGLAGEWALHCFDTTYDYGRGLIWIGPRRTCTEPPFNRAGLRVTKSDDGLTVSEIVPGSPAAKAGINAGDKIVSIDGHAAATLSARDAGTHFSGPIGSTIDVDVASKASGDVQHIRLTLADLIP